MSVEPQFIAPLAKVDLSSRITPSEVAFTDNLKMVPNQQNLPGAGLHFHAHSNSIISGSFYYTELPDPPSRVFFDRSTAYQRLDLPPSRAVPICLIQK